jgi:predicted DNA-binding antitoxin AbrB/MazE fold protein
METRRERMATIVRAVYEKGVLRPLRPLDLSEAQQVRIQIWSENGSEQEEILGLMVDAGLMHPHPQSAPPPPLSEEARRALAEEIGGAPGKPISEMIIEDRG